MADYSTSNMPTITYISRTVYGNKRIHTVTLTMDGSSTIASTGYFALTAANLGLGTIEKIDAESGISGLMWTYDYVNSRLYAYTANGSPGATALMVIAAGATPPSSYVRITATGTGLK